MNEFVKIAFGPISAPKGGTFVVFVGADLKASPRVAALLGEAAARIEAAAKTARFHGKTQTSLDILEPSGVEAARLLVVGVAPGKDGKPIDFPTLGGFVFGKLGAAKSVEVAFEAPAGDWDGGAAADFALGLRLRAYRFDKYKTVKKNGDDGDDTPPSITIATTRLRCGARRRARAHGGRRWRRTRPRPGQRAAERALSRSVRRTRERA